MASKLLKAVSPLAAASGGIKSFAQNFSPAYNLAKGKDDENDSMLNKAMRQGAAGKAAGMKEGGKVKSKPKAKKGGRGDGIATRGKTRGKFV